MAMFCFFLTTVAQLLLLPDVGANPDAKRLYDDLLSGYNRSVKSGLNQTRQKTATVAALALAASINTTEI
jgi:hypothetical protein